MIMGRLAHYFAVLAWLAGFPALSLADDCQPSTWKRGTVGEIVCRYTTKTPGIVSSSLCAEYAALYHVKLDQLLGLNPGLDSSCSNIMPNTEYCVKGFVKAELVSDDGFCGAAHGNATCANTKTPCCNVQTGKCGNSGDDCAYQVCDSRFSTGCEMGRDTSNSTVESACCNVQGRCGNGPEFCGLEVCATGNCTIDIVEIPKMASAYGRLPWLTGTTRDGTCGGSSGYTCDIVFGKCCGPDGVCASDEMACGGGCQPEFGQCW